MLYYLMLIGICVVVGLVVLWLAKEASTIGKKTASTIGKKTKQSGGRASATGPTDHLNGVSVNTAISGRPVSWGGEGSLRPKHPARNQPAMPSRSRYWDLPDQERNSDKLHAYPGGSKTRSELWNYLVPTDRPGHGTGVKPGRRTRIKPGGHGTGISQGRSS